MTRRFVLLVILLPLGCFALPHTRIYNNGININESSAKAKPPGDTIKNIINKLQAYFTNDAAEQAYFHFDKPYYAAGDTIYFKAYVTIGEKHELSARSGILNVDLIDPANQVNRSLKLQLINGTTWGDFALPDTLAKGYYRVRVYTKWMLNFGDNSYFNQIVPIGTVNAAKIPEAITSQPQTITKPDIQFFPEGGRMITGLRSKVAFKAIGGNGLGIHVKGVVFDNENKQVATVVSAHLGMGVFDFVPLTGKTYKAKLSYPDGSTTAIVDLPHSNPDGIVLAIGDDPGNRAAVSIAASNSYYQKNKNKAFTLLIYSGGDVSNYTCPLDSQVVTFDIKKQTLHTGIAAFTLFSPAGEPLSERLVFVQNNDLLNLKVSSDKPVYTKRENVTLKLNAKDITGSPSKGQFSVSVIDEGKVSVDENTENTILTTLLLTADLKGYVEQPNYYFSNQTAKTDSALDLVMLTHGYRRFEWRPLLNNTYPPVKYQAEKNLEISGVVKPVNNKPITKGTISLFSIQGGPMLNQEFGDDGAFSFTNLAFMDSARYVIKASDEKLKDKVGIRLNIERPIPVATDTSAIFKPGDVNKIMPAYLQNREMQVQDMAKYRLPSGAVLKEVKVKSSYLSSNLGGAGHADQVIRRSDIKGSSGSFSVLFEHRLNGVKFVGDEGNKTPYLIMTRSLSQGAETPMMIVLDGVAISPGSSFSIDAINVDDIETIEVLKSVTSSGIYGINGGAGVLVITTRPGVVDQPVALTKGILPIWPKGFYKAREFYSPKYDHLANAVNRKDLRTTIYWNPDLITDKTGNISFDYYNADGTGSYRVVIEGIDVNGNLGRQVYRYKVE